MTSTNPIWDDSNLASADPFQRTTKAWAIANTLSAVQARIAQDNANRIAEYNQQWNDYVQNRFNHPTLNITPPMPAVAEVVVYDASGWPEAGPGTQLVCVPNVYQEPKHDPTLSTAAGGMMGQMVREGGTNGAASPFNAGVPLFTQLVTASDGSKWQRVG